MLCYSVDKTKSNDNTVLKMLQYFWWLRFLFTLLQIHSYRLLFVDHASKSPRTEPSQIKTLLVCYDRLSGICPATWRLFSSHHECSEENRCQFICSLIRAELSQTSQRQPELERAGTFSVKALVYKGYGPFKYMKVIPAVLERKITKHRILRRQNIEPNSGFNTTKCSF